VLQDESFSALSTLASKERTLVCTLEGFMFVNCKWILKWKDGTI